jgi:hypothetical protein
MRVERAQAALPQQIGGCREIQQLQTIRFSTMSDFLAVMRVTFARDARQHVLATRKLYLFERRCFLHQTADADRITPSGRAKGL